jgi:hypothetical protein
MDDATKLAEISAAIAESDIVRSPLPGLDRLPEGFDEVDHAILVWLAAEGRRGRASAGSARELTPSAGRPPRRAPQVSHCPATPSLPVEIIRLVVLFIAANRFPRASRPD